MINVRDVTISDLLPYTMKTPKNIALSKAFGEMTRYLYDTLQSVVFWADIKTASDMLLNSMAAEIDCPFYENGMSIEQKRELIEVSDIYNSRTGTTSAVDKLIAAAFKNGNIQEWYEYGGNPYCFKINMDSELSKSEMNDFNYFFSMLRKIKNARSKLEVINISKDLPTSDLYSAGVITYICEDVTVKVDTTSENAIAYSVANIGVYISDVEQGRKYPAQRYNTYDDIKNITNEQINDKTFAELLYKED